jgi:fermentation-respiration switch protein FrsA (DUF1100 family)
MASAAHKYSKLDIPEVLAVTFHPQPEPSEQSIPANAVDLTIPVADGVELGARFFMTDDPKAVNILFFHGNGEIVADYNDVGPMYNEQNINLLAVDYRGYGRSNGTPTISNMMTDAVTVLNETKKWLKAHNREGYLVVMGRSLGCVPALELTAEHAEDTAALIVESGFAETLPLLENLGIKTADLDLTESDCFYNVEKIRKITKPVLIIHAQKDSLIPLEQAMTLHAECEARAKEIQIVPGADHSNIFDIAGRIYFEVVKMFVNKIGMRKRPKKMGVR